MLNDEQWFLRSRDLVFNHSQVLEDCSSHLHILGGWTATGKGEWVPTCQGKNATAHTPWAVLGRGAGTTDSVWKPRAPASIHLKPMLLNPFLPALEKIVSRATLWVFDPHHTAHTSPGLFAFAHTDQRISGTFKDSRIAIMTRCRKTYYGLA